jgi:hypothetical protein
MRNFSPDSYAYKMISVINPHRPELQEDYSGNQPGKEAKQIISAAGASIQLRTERKVYASSEQINFEISAGNNADLNGKLVVSVIPKGTEIKHVYQSAKSPDSEFTPGLIPETRGVSVSGKIINEADSRPLTSTLVGLTVLNGSPENLNILTDDKGRFYFDLNNRKGESEIFISARATAENSSPSILVDNDFSSESIDLPFVPVNFSPVSKALYRSLTLNTQIRQRYAEKQDSVLSKPAAITPGKIFYGDPEFVIRLEDYIAMPSVQDYFFELIRNARVRKDGNKHVLKVINKYGELENYEPLILLDMVSVFDLEKILELKPEKLDRIEIITAQFIRGNITYGGIVSFFSKKHDLAGIDLPSSGRFITYKMLSEDQPAAVSGGSDPRIPDMRSCLYWNPGVQIKSGETRELSFSSGDNAGEYLIVVQGVDQSGQLKVTTSEILIK